MITRDFILDTLAALPVWTWPVFLWEVYWLDNYLKARRAEGGSGLVGYAVTMKGRIVITLDARGDCQSFEKWTAFVPPAPCRALASGAGLAGLAISELIEAAPVKARCPFRPGHSSPKTWRPGPPILNSS
jgi:hypothetical protein